MALWLVSVLLCMCVLARWRKYVKMYIGIVSVAGMVSNGQFHFGCGSKMVFILHQPIYLKRFEDLKGFGFDKQIWSCIQT